MRSLLQTKEWGDFKVKQGWRAHRIDGISVLEKKLSLGKSFLYAPEVEWNLLQTTKIYENTKNLAKNRNSPLGIIFFRLEILDEFNEKIVQKLKNFKFVKSFEEVQPEWRQIIALSKSEEEILAQMKPKGRYNIRVAEKHGVIVEKSINIDDFYKIFRETAKRDGFELRPKQYFEKLMEIFGQAKIAELWVAKYNKRVIAAEIVTFYDGVATYLYGASSDECRNVMAPYLLHWEVIKEAKKRGMKKYDLLAVSPGEAYGKQLAAYSKNDNHEAVSREPSAVSHKYAGITRFKEQFGGRKVHLVGSWDLVFKPTWYGMFKIVEKYRRK